MLLHNLHDYSLLQALRLTPVDPWRRFSIVPKETGSSHPRYEYCIAQGYTSRLQCYLETTRAQRMAPYKKTLGLGRQPAKMGFRPSLVSCNTSKTVICTRTKRFLQRRSSFPSGNHSTPLRHPHPSSRRSLDRSEITTSFGLGQRQLQYFGQFPSTRPRQCYPDPLHYLHS